MSADLTPKQKKFAAHLVKWQRKLGLTDWRIGLRPEPAGKDSLAEVQSFYTDRVARIWLDDAGSADIDSIDLEALALHELLHVALFDLTHALDMRTRAQRQEHYEAAEHIVIARLLKTLLPKSTL